MATQFEETSRLFFDMMAILGAPNLEFKLWDEVTKGQIDWMLPLLKQACGSDEKAVDLVSKALV